MDKRINITLDLYNLPQAPNCHELAVKLEERIKHAVELAIVDVYEDGLDGKEYELHVPSF